jgi:predicted transcriptional regulator
VDYTYGELVEKILNRTKDGFCPMESAVLDVNEPNEAYCKIKETLSKIKRNNK